MPRPIRLTPEQQQEQKSLGQLKVCFADVGWTEARPPDLGEDVIYSVYYEGRATGVNFYVQLKSITDLCSRRREDYVPYSFAVKDLLHWEQFAYPVVLIVWDVSLNEGRWVLAKAAIAELDARRPGWRGQTTATARVPWSNATDAPGLDCLRLAIGRYLLPLLLSDESIEMTLSVSVPDDEQGRETMAALERMVKEGEALTLRGSELLEVRWPDRITPWIEPFDPTSGMVIVEPSPRSSQFPARITAIGDGGTRAELPYLDMRVVRGGTEVVTLANDTQVLGIRLELRLNRETGTFTASVSMRPDVQEPDVVDALRTLDFAQAVSEGGLFELEFYGHATRPLTVRNPAMPQWAVDPTLHTALRQVRTIQDRANVRIRIPIGGMTGRDLALITLLHEIVQGGKTVTRVDNMDLTFGCEDPHAFARHLARDRHVLLTVPTDDSYAVLFESRVELGPKLMTIAGVVPTPLDEIEAAWLSARPGDVLPLKLVDCEITTEYPNWQAGGE